MPACLAASMIVIPLGTLICAPSIVTVTVSSGMHFRESVRRLPRPLDVGVELPAEFLDTAHDGSGAGVAEHADGLAGHALREVEQELEVGLLALPGQDPLQHA